MREIIAAQAAKQRVRKFQNAANEDQSKLSGK